MIDQNTLNIGIAGVLILNFVSVIWLIGRTNQLIKKSKRPSTDKHNSVIPAADRQQLLDNLQKKADTEVSAVVKQLDDNLKKFAEELKNSLLSQAGDSLKQQLSQPEKMINDFNTSMSATLQNLTMALREAASSAQNKLETGVDEQQKLIVSKFEQNMATVINNYLVAALGDVSSDQTVQVIQALEANKDDLKRDLLHGN